MVFYEGWLSSILYQNDDENWKKHDANYFEVLIEISSGEHTLKIRLINGRWGIQWKIQQCESVSWLLRVWQLEWIFIRIGIIMYACLEFKKNPVMFSSYNYCSFHVWNVLLSHFRNQANRTRRHKSYWPTDMGSIHSFNHNSCTTANNVNITVPLTRFEYELIMHPYLRMPSFVINEIKSRILSGSSAEFLTDEPFNTMGDVDVMWYKESTLGFFEDLNEKLIDKYKYCFPPSNTIYKIIPDERYPGYVKVWRSCDLKLVRGKNALAKQITFCSRKKPKSAYRFRSQRVNFRERMHQKCQVKGPAQKISYLYRSFQPGCKYEEFNIDDVPSILCYSWPPEASDWITRPRKHGWPDPRTISLVVENGCHIVPSAHSDCELDEYQWRISFSKAEIVLMRAMTPSKHYIYHMLRFFAKRELILKDWSNSDRVVTMYMLKTLMLWQCERQIIEILENGKYNWIMLSYVDDIG